MLKSFFVVFRVYFLFFRKQENIFFSSRNNKYTILLYEQNAQFTKVAPPPTQHCLTVCVRLMHRTVITVISIFYSYF